MEFYEGHVNFEVCGVRTKLVFHAVCRLHLAHQLGGRVACSPAKLRYIPLALTHFRAGRYQRMIAPPRQRNHCRDAMID